MAVELLDEGIESGEAGGDSCDGLLLTVDDWLANYVGELLPAPQ